MRLIQCVSVVLLGAGLWGGCSFDTRGLPATPVDGGAALDSAAPDASTTPARSCLTDLTYIARPESEHRYRPGLVGLPWIDAQAACTDDGAYLAVIDDAAENAFVRSTVATDNIWIGLSDRDVERTYIWVNGAPLDYENWSGGKPSDSDGEDCVEVYPGGTWNDKECHEPRAYVCECKPAA